MNRPLPPWFDVAEFGIFVHWGPYSVPAWAPTGELWREHRANPRLFTELDDAGWRHAMAMCPYADWYWNTVSIDGSPTQRRHAELYGTQPYHVFGEQFADALHGWDPEAWADLFASAGARYVVFNTKDADGFAMYPSQYQNPHLPNWQLDRDVVGELATACRARGMRFGAFFTAGLDWTFTPPPVLNPIKLAPFMPDDEHYHQFVSLRIREVIDRYRPDILWNDMGWPPSLPYDDVFRYYYERVPDGVINDRFDATAGDFTTPEYRTEPTIPGKKWEMCRAIGSSFGYNTNEGPACHLTTADVCALRADVNSRGGNLLLNVGPAADGTIPALQRQVVEGLAAD